MASNDNFRQAFKDFFKTDKEKDKPAGGPAAAAPSPPPSRDMPETDAFAAAGAGFDNSFYEAEPAQAGAPAGGYYAGYDSAPPAAPQDIYSSSPPPEPPPADGAIAYTSRDTSYISKGTTIVGRIHTDGHLEVLGRIQGNIDAEGDVTVKGGVSGDIAGDHLGLYSCKVKGNLKGESGVVISNESIIVGDVQTENVILDGMLKGNISGNQMVMLKSNAYHLGDISAHSISVENGAILNGNVKTLIDYDAESPFYDV